MAECVNCKSQLSFFNTTQPLWEKTNQKLCSSCYRVIRDKFLSNPSIELYEQNEEYLIQHHFTQEGLDHIKAYCEYNDMKKAQKAHAQTSKTAYCLWYSNQIKSFINEVKQSGFNPTWGFESIGESDLKFGAGGKAYGNLYVFDVPELEGLVFDMNSKQMLYYQIPTGYYETYNDPNVKFDFKYVIIPFSDIFNASLLVDSHTVVTTISSKQNVISRSIVGGVLAGSVGAIIGGTTGNENSISTSENVVSEAALIVQTINVEHPVITIKFNRSLYYYKEYFADRTIADTMYGIFYDKEEYVRFEERAQNRNCNTSVDYIYCLIQKEPDYDHDNETEFMRIFNEVLPIRSLDMILKRLKKYIMKIESIIEQENKEEASNSVKSDFMEELKALVEMKEKGYITDDEFVIFKSRLLK